MKANELRIGNLIQHVTGDLITVNKIEKGEFSTIHAYSASGDSKWNFEINGVMDAAFKPIPLTIDRLIGAGFEPMQESEYTLNTYEYRGVKIWHRNKNEFVFEPTGIRLEYFHRLQNLFFELTNMELTK